MNLVTPTTYDLTYLAGLMREDERDQFCALHGLPEYSPDFAARQLAALPPEVSFALLSDDGLPVAAGGFVEVRHGVWQSWMVGTDAGWEKHWREITKACRRVMDNLLASDRCHRIETVCLASRTKAGRWYMKALGERFEGTHRGWFADGRDAAWYARTKEKGDVL